MRRFQVYFETVPGHRDSAGIFESLEDAKAMFETCKNNGYAAAIVRATTEVKTFAVWHPSDWSERIKREQELKKCQAEQPTA